MKQTNKVCCFECGGGNDIYTLYLRNTDGDVVGYFFFCEYHWNESRNKPTLIHNEKKYAGDK